VNFSPGIERDKGEHARPMSGDDIQDFLSKVMMMPSFMQQNEGMKKYKGEQNLTKQPE
jgi:hypothetical protein